MSAGVGYAIVAAISALLGGGVTLWLVRNARKGIEARPVIEQLKDDNHALEAGLASHQSPDPTPDVLARALRDDR